MRRILFCLIAALVTTTAMAKGGPPAVEIEYDLGFFVISTEVDPREAGQLLAQCRSKGEIDFLTLTVDCSDPEMVANRGGSRVIRFYIGLSFFGAG